ncbi:maleylpyruvate isomerase family mycothiol-dependent enzyme [Amycolatopsis sp. EV170708-02-1]|uniref:maleylpyruvate isomerase family mycothiol-dependent enzyme n=1 Tax=Amycolatopsis sp. EV170708-02-1 TaxID=2919322 RepID=UPI001F0BE94D|nr:maleylpyruvate isomerase family mycothiol-dependent enzyme [Amycolatopsis sp. EV170708-02-1]UMP00890.1 maleylpyruvate isomerase family mycothiol-dependent enzyme [Amycolatopsis sp. EV170708-02-1]
MTPDEYLERLRELTTGFARVAGTGDHAASVPCCGDWRLRDLVVHLGNVHRWAAGIVRTGEPAPQDLDAEPGGDLAPWYRESADELIEALREAAPQDGAWNFTAAAKTKAFWYRRQVHETAVHLLDAHRAAGAGYTLDPNLAADGVDEVLLGMLPKVKRWHTPPTVTVPLLLKTSDTGHAWLITPPGETDVPGSRQADPAEAAGAVVSGTAEALDLLLWQRIELDGAAIEITGDAAAAKTFLAGPLTP